MGVVKWADVTIPLLLLLKYVSIGKKTGVKQRKMFMDITFWMKVLQVIFAPFY